jgi:hypothetical protein
VCLFKHERVEQEEGAEEEAKIIKEEKKINVRRG